jgi:hypothetical protein
MKKPVVWLVRGLGLGLCLLLSACVFVQSSSISAATGRGTPVSTQYSDYGILRLTVPEGLTTGANAALVSQCQSGMISDVQTELSMRDWLGIVQYYTVTATGDCR